MKYAGWAFPLVFLIGLSGTTYSTYLMNQDIEGTHKPTLTGPIWFVTGLQTDILKFQNAVLEYNLGNLEASEVVLRFDLLWSKASVVSTGQTFEEINDQVEDVSVLQAVFDTIKDLEPEIEALGKNEVMSVDSITSAFTTHEKSLNLLKLELLEHRSLTEQSFRESILKIDYLKNIIFGVAAVLAVFLVLFLSISRTRQRNELAEKSRLLGMAQRANEAKSNFLSVVNHELRTPLTSISGSLRLLGAGSLLENEKARQLVEIANRNADRLALIIDDILDVERIERGIISLDCKPVNLCEVVALNVENIQSFREARGVKVELACVCDNVNVFADSGRISQVITNLLSNAVKFSDRGTTVYVSVEPGAEHHRIVVRDEGRGIPKDVLPHIFDKFYQAEEADRRNENGSGLGLNIVRSIVQAHNGTIDVESVIGEGATFTVSIPVYEQAEVERHDWQQLRAC